MSTSTLKPPLGRPARLISEVGRKPYLPVAIGVLVLAVVAGYVVRTSHAATVSIWPDSATPAVAADPDNQAVEVGVKFNSDASGKVTGIRFYKGTGNGGTHIGSLWNSSGTKLGSVTFSGETATGWQTASFTTPVSITAGTTYVASYFAPQGHYASTSGGLANAADAPPLHALSGASSGGNGVYVYSATSAFPTQSFQNTNYWVDLIFQPDQTSGSVVGDLNNDNTVNIFDLSILLSKWGTSDATADLNHDGTVNIFDLSTLLSHWGQTATPTPTSTRTPTPSATPMPSVTPTPSGTPSACANGGTYLWSNLVTCGWPGPGNVGYPAGTVFTNTSGRTITTSNTVINGEKITGRLYINAQNVTIKNSWIISTGGGTNGTGVIEIQPGASATIDHVTIDGGNNAHACVWHMGAGETVTAADCFNVNDGFFSWQDTGGTTQGNNFSIQDSYIHNLTTATGNGHIDGYQTEGANNGVIRHNTFDINQDQNAAVSVWDGYKSSDNILIDNNLLTGGGFTVYAEDYSPSESSPSGGFSVTNVRITNNKFSNRYYGCIGYWGIWYPRGAPTDGWRRTGNVVLETGVNVDSGNPTYNGSVCN